ncbi:hypothetical protein [Bosea sp. PAMC 26642]|uniref:hypothetical protein n=1 Tax=Bosea sp. (strain PAMC 26642) TaxID=1792307 RepID=UPI00077002DE|nr:hypothetical protein [Bosea sp. PAMC 26642]AMJ59650.1 hypothetical protein AXW83_04430 [Bosea sp. PAMC 26642]
MTKKRQRAGSVTATVNRAAFEMVLEKAEAMLTDRVGLPELTALHGRRLKHVLDQHFGIEWLAQEYSAAMSRHAGGDMIDEEEQAKSLIASFDERRVAGTLRLVPTSPRKGAAKVPQPKVPQDPVIQTAVLPEDARKEVDRSVQPTPAPGNSETRAQTVRQPDAMAMALKFAGIGRGETKREEEGAGRPVVEIRLLETSEE